MKNMELVIYNPSEGGFVKEISFNYEEIKKQLEDKLQTYKGLTYTEDSIKEAKTDRANLNKLKTAIDDKKKEIKNKCMEPYTEFEKKIKELLSLVDEPVAEIDTQIKSFEAKKKQEKKEMIEAFYEQEIGELEETLPLDSIWSDKWLNATTSFKKVTEEIKFRIDKVNQELEVIKNLGSEFEVELLNKYTSTYDLAVTLQHKSKLEEQKKRIEEQKRLEEERREKERLEKEEQERKNAEIYEQQKAAAEEEKRQQEEARTNMYIEEEPFHEDETSIETSRIIEELGEMSNPTLESTPDPKANPIPCERIEFVLWLTEEQKEFLRKYIKENNIKWEKK